MRRYVYSVLIVKGGKLLIMKIVLEGKRMNYSKRVMCLPRERGSLVMYSSPLLGYSEVVL